MQETPSEYMGETDGEEHRAEVTGRAPRAAAANASDYYRLLPQACGGVCLGMSHSGREIGCQGGINLAPKKAQSGLCSLCHTSRSPTETCRTAQIRSSVSRRIEVQLLA